MKFISKLLLNSCDLGEKKCSQCEKFTNFHVELILAMLSMHCQVARDRRDPDVQGKGIDDLQLCGQMYLHPSVFTDKRTR